MPCEEKAFKDKKILIITTVSGFLQKFEAEDVRILQDMGYEVHYAANPAVPVYTDRGVKGPDTSGEGRAGESAEFPADPFKSAEADGGKPCRSSRDISREAAPGEGGCGVPGVIFHGIPIAKSPFDISSNGRALRQVKELIRAEHITAIHCHTPTGSVIGRIAGRAAGIKVIYTAHGFHFYNGGPAAANLVYRTAERLLARFTDVLIVINHEDYEAAKRFKLRPGGALYLIPGVGLDTKKFSPASYMERDAARKRLGIKDDEFFLLSVGELNKNKNHETVIRSLSIIKKKDTGGRLSKIRYTVCGEGPYRGRLEEVIESEGLAESVSLPGYCSPVREYLAAADAFAFPSRREGLPMAALEALSMGIIVIAAKNRGTDEYMEDGVNGLVCAWDDEEAFARAIERAVLLSESERKSMSQSALASAAAFSKEKTKTIMAEIYRKHL